MHRQPSFFRNLFFLILLALFLLSCQVELSQPFNKIADEKTFLSAIATRTQVQINPHPLSEQPITTPTFTPSLKLEATPFISPTAKARSCLFPAGTMEENSFHSLKLQRNIAYRIWLPPCYIELADTRFPVLYLLHGQSFNEDQWDRLGADEVAARLITNEKLTAFIIVMPYDPDWKQPRETGFDEMVIEELIPMIDEHYRTQANRQGRVIGGLSRGGAWAVHLGLHDWDLFSAIGAHSPAIFWSDTLAVQRWIEEIPDGMLPRIYIDIGDADRPEIMHSAVWFEELLTGKGIAHEWHLYHGEHDETYWKKHVEEYIRWYAAGLSLDP